MGMRFFALLLLITSCKSIPQGSFKESAGIASPNYSNFDLWAALPMKEDKADKTPGNLFKDMQSEAFADVFFIHPTSYTKQKGNTEWNGALDDEKLNEKTDEGAILFQASVFNGAAKIYAPRYRQAHIHVYFTEEEAEERLHAKKALSLAYSDVKSAFEYYLENWNNGRPIIIASHSQGTTHAMTLINEFFENKPLKKQLVAAYLVGMPVRESTFPTLKPCESAEETTCFVSWRSYQRGFLPKWHEAGSDIVVTNPLSWTRETSYVPADKNQGTVLLKFENGITPGIADAQIYEDHLWVNKPKFKGSAFMTFKNYHIADYNLFYADIRENVRLRVEHYLERENR